LNTCALLSTATVAAAAAAGTAEGIRFPSDQSLRLFHIDLDRDRIVPYAEKVDFSNAATVEGKGASNCHGLAFNYV
jgi:hypothetical protein